jgi:RsiW-degrading membrane proteinase PrsW (M82 family)
MPELASLFFGFGFALFYAYIIYWVDRYEKEPKLLLGAVFLWGVIIAGGGAFIINTTIGVGMYMFTGSEAASDIGTTTIVAPIVEESLKGLAVLVVFLLFRKEFDSVLDGIVYAGIAALGFAALENSYYIYTYGWQDGGWEGFWYLVFVRVILVGWQHPFYTAFTGIGIALARLNRNILARLILPVIGYSVAVFAHALHNTIATFAGGIEGLIFGTALDWIGLGMMILIILWAIWHEARNIKQHLVEEARLGLITPAQYRTASSALLQSFAGFGSIFTGRYSATARFYQVCGELAHKKMQFAKFGDESGNAQEIARLRAELQSLAPKAQA